jgi:hypothetical protein
MADYFDADPAEGNDFLPDLDVIPLEEPLDCAGGGAGREGFLVCSTSPGLASQVQAGDVITHVKGQCPVMLASDRAKLRAAAASSGDTDRLHKSALIDWAVGGQRLGKDVASKIFDRLDPDESGLVSIDECCAALSEALAKPLLGKYKSKVELTVWRPPRTPAGGSEGGEGGGVLAEQEVKVECLRTRDARRRADPPTPERCG